MSSGIVDNTDRYRAPIFVTDIYVQRDWECAVDTSRSSESLTLSERGGKWESRGNMGNFCRKQLLD